MPCSKECGYNFFKMPICRRIQPMAYSFSVIRAMMFYLMPINAQSLIAHWTAIFAYICYPLLLRVLAVCFFLLMCRALTCTKTNALRNPSVFCGISSYSFFNANRVMILFHHNLPFRLLRSNNYGWIGNAQIKRRQPWNETNKKIIEEGHSHERP